MPKDRPGTDFNLGKEVHNHLLQLGIETPMDPNWENWNSESVDIGHFADSFEVVLKMMGLNLLDDSLKDTPHRVAKMYLFEIFKGLDYRNFPKCTAIENKVKVDEVIICKGISVWSLCEHHLVPFIGTASVGYIPGKKLLGLSKFNRIVDFFARRPQVQERLTEQIYATLAYVLDTPDVAVVVDCVHNCVRLRGIKDVCSATVTSKMGGRFLSKPEARSEFLSLIR